MEEKPMTEQSIEQEISEKAKLADSVTKAAEEKAEAAKNASQPGTLPRQVVLDARAKMVVKTGDKEEILRPYRNVISVMQEASKLPDDAKITVYWVEDPEQSSPSDGAPYEVNFLVDKKDLSKKDFLDAMLKTVATEYSAVNEFQRLCEFMSCHSSLKAALVTLVFKGKEKPAAAGFSYLTSCDEVSNDDLIALGEAAKSQTEMCRDKIKSIHPEISFPSESKIILPR